MKILLDESVPKALGFELSGHFVRNVQTMGWSGVSNGRLLKLMADNGFEVLISCDQNKISSISRAQICRLLS